MDFLKAAIKEKKRELSSVESSDVDNPSKYVKRVDLERARAAAHSATPPPAVTATTAERASTPVLDTVRGATPVQSPSKDASPAPGTAEEETTTTFNVSNEEAVKRLRARGQPIRLFGESDKERRLRLRALQLMEERGGGSKKTAQNEFSKAMAGIDEGLALKEIEKSMGATTSGESTSATTAPTVSKKRSRSESATPATESEADSGEVHPKDAPVIIDLSLVKSNPHKIYPQIYHALKRMLKDWEDTMNERPDDVKRSTQGKIAAATQQTSAVSLKPLFKKLRNRAFDEEDVLKGIAEIVYHIQVREYLKANDAYLRLSIGNAAWPMGVGNVGIHERKAREKLFENKVGHALNDETSRKYISALKRLITFSQAKYPPYDSSQLMG